MRVCRQAEGKSICRELVLIGLYFVWRENKRERKAEQKKQECNKQQPEE